jgi:spermidine/putrescine transport system substrate-binding protein
MPNASRAEGGHRLNPTETVPSTPINRGVTREEFIRRSAYAAAALSAYGLVGAGCGDEDGDEGGGSASGTLRMLNFPGWLGEKEVARFRREFPAIRIKQIAVATGSISARAAQVQQNRDGYDLVLADTSLAAQLDASDLVAELDMSRIPNNSHVAKRFRDAYPLGVANDFGKVGIAYRKDLIPERPTRWTDIWDLAPKYSKKIVFAGLDRDCMGSVLKSLGYSGNSRNPDEIEECKQALLEIKPHLMAFLDVDVAKPLIRGTAVIAMDWDYDVALARQEEKNIEWVAPEEGMVAYLNGWVGVAGSELLPAVESFMNFHLAPRNYAHFINTVGSAFVEPSAARFIDPAIRNDPVLQLDDATLDQVEFQEFLGDATPLWSRTWSEVLSA